MKRFFIILFLIFTSFFIKAQHQIDTVYTLDSIWQNDTLFIIKTMHLTVIIEDTNKINTPKIDTNSSIIQSNNNQNPIPLKPIKKHNILHTRISPFLEFGFFKTKNSTFNPLLDSTISGWWTNTYGANFEIEQKHTFYSTGFQITNFYENFSLKDNWNTVDSSIITHINVNSHWNVDTIWFINLDSLLVGDTVWMPYYDSTQITEYDTSYSTDFDTTFHNTKYNKLNKIRYIEFPIIFGFHFGKRKWKFHVKTGLITGYSISKNYVIGLPKDQGNISGKFANFSFWSYSKINIQYSFSDKFYGRFGIYARIPINNQLLIMNTHRKYYSWGLSFGVNWKF